MKVYAPAAVTVSALNATGWDANLICPAARQITADDINETTALHGTYITNPRGPILAWVMAGG